MKTKFNGSIIVTLKMFVASIPAGLLMGISRVFAPDKQMLILGVGLFSLWFTGWCANRLWNWK